MLRRTALLFVVVCSSTGCTDQFNDLQSAQGPSVDLSKTVLLQLSRRQIDPILSVIDPLERDRLDRPALEAVAALVPKDVESHRIDYRWDARKAGAPESTDVQSAVNFYFQRDGVDYIALVGVVRKAGAFYVNHVLVSPRNGVDRIVLNQQYW